MSVQEPTSHRGGGSGGYLEHVFRHAAQELFGIHVDEVTYKPLRSVGRDTVGAASALGPLDEVGLAEDSELGLAQILSHWTGAGPLLWDPLSGQNSLGLDLPTVKVGVPGAPHGSPEPQEARGGRVVEPAQDVLLGHPISQEEGRARCLTSLYHMAILGKRGSHPTDQETEAGVESPADSWN